MTLLHSLQVHDECGVDHNRATPEISSRESSTIPDELLLIKDRISVTSYKTVVVGQRNGNKSFEKDAACPYFNEEAGIAHKTRKMRM